MKPLTKTILQALAMAAVFSVPFLFAESNVGEEQLPANMKAPAQSRITADELSKAKLAHKQGFDGAEQTSDLPMAAALSIYDNSTILVHGGNHTVLPPRAVLHLPKKYQGKISTHPVGKYIPWPEFYLANRQWLFTYQVTERQALGQDAINENVTVQFQKMNRLVVSLLENHPVSVAPKRPSE
ncbi:MAG: hypothetical protein ACPG32_05825 [Akkermansiaceae bacterium]